jgi:hypothetical protein
MRILTTVALISLLAAPAFGQRATTSPYPYGLDPYKPSDAEWLRNYGAALVAQTPLLELRALDPYKPSDAALLRQIGGALPLCCPNWPGFGPTFGPLTPATTRGVAPGLSSGSPTVVPGGAVVVVNPPASADSTPAPVAPGPTSISTAIAPQSNDGVWIRYAGQTWISAGRAVPLAGAEFQRVGEYARFPVYKLARGGEDVIYVPSREGLVAPYRLKP